MASLLGLYVSYVKAAVLVMVWAAVAFAAYGFIRSSAVAEVIAAAAISLAVSLGAALVLADLVWPSHPVRKVLFGVFASVLALLGRPGSHTGRKQEI